MKFNFTMDFGNFDSKNVFLSLKNINFENMFFNKSYLNFYVVKSMDAYKHT